MPDEEHERGRAPWAGRDAERSATLIGAARFGAGAALAQGSVLRSIDDRATVGAGSMLLENSVAVASSGLFVGRRSVFGHRCVVIDATVGDLCEIGNGSIILSGARLGNRCFLGEGTLIPAGASFGDDRVIVGRPGRVIRRADDTDIARLTALRGGTLELPAATYRPVAAHPNAGASMGAIYEYRGVAPTIDPTAVVFDSAELTGDVVIGPACMIHGCHIGAGTVVEPAAIVCDGAIVGEGCVVGAGSLVRQRQRIEPHTHVEGFPAAAVATLDTAPARPSWALRPDDVDTITRRR